MSETTYDDRGEPISISPLAMVTAFRDDPAPQAGDFDFLIGDWDVRGSRFAPSGAVSLEYTGTWHAEHLGGRRMVLDHFTAATDEGGPFAFFATLRTWSPFTRRWEMTFLAALQPQRLESFTGRRVDEEMHLEAVAMGLDGGRAQSKVRFHDIAQDSFGWEQTTSVDGGATWVLEARIRATRRVRLQR